MNAIQSRKTPSETWSPSGDRLVDLMSTTMGERIRVARGHRLFSQGDVDPRFYVVLSGKVKIYSVSAHGHELLFDIHGAGGVLGESSALLGLPRHSNARMIEDSDLLMLHADQMEHYVVREPKLAMGLIHALGANQRRLIERLEHSIFATPEERILGVLSQRSDLHPREVENDPVVRVNLTREQIGNLTGLSRVTVTRALMRLKRQGAIARSCCIAPPHRRCGKAQPSAAGRSDRVTANRGAPAPRWSVSLASDKLQGAVSLEHTETAVRHPNTVWVPLPLRRRNCLDACAERGDLVVRVRQAQLGYTLCRRRSVQSTQKVHSYEQIRARVSSGARSMSQYSQLGRSASAMQFSSSGSCAVAHSA